MTSDLPAPAAKRLSAPSWRDSRLLVGVLLVLTSVVLGALAVGAADSRVGVWAAKDTLAPGDQLVEAQLVRVEVQLGDQSAKYLTTAGGVPTDSVVDRVVRPGELVPRSAVMNSGGLDVVAVPVGVDRGDLTGITKGATVRLLAAEPMSASDRQAGTLPTYQPLVERATVKHVPEDKPGLIQGGTAARATVLVLVPREDAPAVLSYDEGEQPLRMIAEGGSVGGSSP